MEREHVSKERPKDGQSVIDALRWSPDPPVTLLQDLLETSARIGHRAIARVQRQMVERLSAERAKVERRFRRVQETHPKHRYNEAMASAQRALEHVLDTIRLDAQEQMQAIFREWDRRDRRIRHFYVNRGGEKGSPLLRRGLGTG